MATVSPLPILVWWHPLYYLYIAAGLTNSRYTPVAAYRGAHIRNRIEDMILLFLCFFLLLFPLFGYMAVLYPFYTDPDSGRGRSREPGSDLSSFVEAI